MPEQEFLNLFSFYILSQSEEIHAFKHKDVYFVGNKDILGKEKEEHKTKMDPEYHQYQGPKNAIDDIELRDTKEPGKQHLKKYNCQGTPYSPYQA
jgi:hypothetical protein